MFTNKYSNIINIHMYLHKVICDPLQQKQSLVGCNKVIIWRHKVGYLNFKKRHTIFQQWCHRSLRYHISGTNKDRNKWGNISKFPIFFSIFWYKFYGNRIKIEGIRANCLKAVNFVIISMTFSENGKLQSIFYIFSKIYHNFI